MTNHSDTAAPAGTPLERFRARTAQLQLENAAAQRRRPYAIAGSTDRTPIEYHGPTS